MFCGRCGSELVAGAGFCAGVGAAVAGGAAGAAAQSVWSTHAGSDLTRLERPRANRMIAGVCAGLAQHYRWDLTWVRVLAVLIAVFSSGAGLVAYIVFWIVMPAQQWMLPSGTVATGPAPPPAA